MSETSDTANLEDFEKLDIRMGRVIDVQPFPEGRYSTHNALKGVLDLNTLAIIESAFELRAVDQSMMITLVTQKRASPVRELARAIYSVNWATAV